MIRQQQHVKLTHTFLHSAISFHSGTGFVGWLYNIILVLCSPPIDQLPGPSGMSVPTIIAVNVGKGGFYALWVFVCFTAFAVVQTAMQANARTFFAFSRDGGLPDRGLFAKLAPNKVPLWGVWIVVLISIILGLLQFASAVAVNGEYSASFHGVMLTL